MKNKRAGEDETQRGSFSSPWSPWRRLVGRGVGRGDGDGFERRACSGSNPFLFGGFFGVVVAERFRDELRRCTRPFDEIAGDWDRRHERALAAVRRLLARGA